MKDIRLCLSFGERRSRRVMIEIISCNQATQWQSILDEGVRYDFYHTASYHQFHQTLGEGDGMLLVYRENGRLAALPLLVRSLSTLEWANLPISQYADATSVYGYGGPVTNYQWSDLGFTSRFNSALLVMLKELHIIAAFSRLHTLLENERGMIYGEVVPLGQTVSIDLTLPEETQFCGYRKTCRYDIRKANALGLDVLWDKDWVYYEKFVRLYQLTMIRLNAPPYYHFDQAYFDNLRLALSTHLHLFVVKLGEEILGGGLFTLVNGIIQYHLSGSNPLYVHLPSTKNLLDAVRRWGNQQGAWVFHLGGGMRSKEDSLFQFKASFSDRRHRFKVWKIILQPALYQQALHQYQLWNKCEGISIDTNSYFPVYRQP